MDAPFQWGIKRGVRRQVITPFDAPGHFQSEAVLERRACKETKDSPLIRALRLAHYWQRLLDDGKYRTLTEIAAAEGMDQGQANRIALVVRPAPENIATLIAEGQSKPGWIGQIEAASPLIGQSRAALLCAITSSREKHFRVS